MPQNFSPNITPQPQPTQPMTPAEIESLKKKRNFEEQQKRLMALKQKSTGQSTGSKVANPLNDLFGKKGSSGGMNSLLGSLGVVTRSKGGTNVFQGEKMLGMVGRYSYHVTIEVIISGYSPKRSQGEYSPIITEPEVYNHIGENHKNSFHGYFKTAFVTMTKRLVATT